MGEGVQQMELTADLVKRCHREVADDGSADKYDYFIESDYPPLTQALLDKRPSGPLWIFAYGSLIWKREFQAVEERRGTAKGWHRAFCLRIARWRATTDQPGFMMALDRGGTCEGVVVRVADGEEYKTLLAILLREAGSHEHLESARWIEVATADGVVQALTFYAGPHTLDYYTADVPLKEVAHGLARACGIWGSGAEYLHNTVRHLEDLGIHDENLWELQRLTAAEIMGMEG